MLTLKQTQGFRWTTWLVLPALLIPTLLTGLLAAQSDKVPAPLVRPTWYHPKELQPDRSYPLAIVLAARRIPVEPNRFWVRSLWEANFCTVVLQPVSGTPADWSKIRLEDVLAEITPLPTNIPAEGSRLLLIAEEASAPVAIGFANAYPERTAGVVLVEADPSEPSQAGSAVWTPLPTTWTVPIWALLRATPADTARMTRWRTFQRSAPSDAVITLDMQSPTKNTPLVANDSFSPWLEAIQAGRRPEAGSNPHAEDEIARGKLLAERIRARLLLDQPALAGEVVEKVEGPMALRASGPAGWTRNTTGEKPYAPLQGPGERGALLEQGEPFVQILWAEDEQAKCNALACSIAWEKSADSLLDYCDRRLIAKGLHPYEVATWRDGSWTYRVGSVLQEHDGTWLRWLWVSAVHMGTPVEPAARMIVMMDRSDQPDVDAIVAALQRLRDSVDVEWTPPADTAPRPLE